ncbi:MAG: PAS domain S-box protein, partial [Rhodospirillales bacterium]|nr:PAS domain S-box protein [Rhodospirillales bacterium]
LADGDKDIEVQFTDQKNEIGDLSRTMDIFLEKTIEMERMREEQKEAETRFKSLFENSDVSIWNQDLSRVHLRLEELRRSGVSDLRQHLEDNPQAATDLAGKIRVVQVNDATLSLFAAESKEDVINRIDRVLASDAFGLIVDELCAIWDKQQIFRAETELPTFDGRRINAIISFRIPETEEGFRDVPVSVIDITERKRSELALKQSERRFDLALRSTKDGIWDWIVDTNELFLSPRWKQMLGYTEEDFSAGDDPFPKLLHRDDLVRVYGAIGEFFDSSESRYEQEFRLRHKDGHYLTVQATAFAERDEQGRVTRFTGRHTDVTQIRETEKQLLQAQKMEAVGHLTGGVAHDFNNLLAIVNLNLGQVQKEMTDDPRLLEMVRRALSAVDRGATLTQRLLSFSRQQALMPVSADLDVLLSGLDDMLRRALGETVEIRIKPASDAWPVFVDAHQLESAILNLALNARDAMPDGGRLTIETANAHLDQQYVSDHDELEAGDYVMLAVSDTGFGIPADKLPRVIEPFYTTKEVGKGSGLGLSMVYGFVKQSKGHFNIYSELGKGTSVKLYLPRDHTHAKDNPTAEDAETPVFEGHERILVVEDEWEVRRAAVEILRLEGYDVFEAADGREALKKLKELDNVDLLFTDVVLPKGISGPALAEKADRLQPGIRALFTTGYAEQAVIRNGVLDKGVNLISKPYSRTELLGRVRATIEAEAAA